MPAHESVLQCVAVCFNVMQSVAVTSAVCCSVLQCVAVCCNNVSSVGGENTCPQKCQGTPEVVA